MKSINFSVNKELQSEKITCREITIQIKRDVTPGYVSIIPLEFYSPSIVHFERPVILQEWCQANHVNHAITGGFFVNKTGISMAPLGELVIKGDPILGVSFDHPWDAKRACFSIDESCSIGPRSLFPEKVNGDLLQAGPLLVSNNLLVDYQQEGFSEGARQFDSDITDGRYPRSAIGIANNKIIIFACDARAENATGLAMDELAQIMLDLGCNDAMNLDGGGSTSFIYNQKMLNKPRDAFGAEPHNGRTIRSAIIFS